MSGVAHDVAVFAMAFLGTVASIAALRRVAVARGWVDRPGALKVHARPVPDIGGLGIALGVGVPLAAVAQRDPALAVPLSLVSVLALGVCLVGFYDDRYGLSPAQRLLFECVAAVVLAWAGSAAGLFGTARSGTVALPLLLAFVTFYVVGAINAINMQDGLDGLAGTLVLISCAVIVVVAKQMGHDLASVVALALSGGLLAFLVFNLPPASVFMGDSGSYFLGFMVATLVLLLSFAANTVTGFAGGVLLVGLPVVDAGIAVGRRVARGQSPFRGDREHLYDRLVARGTGLVVVLMISAVLQTLAAAAGALLLTRP